MRRADLNGAAAVAAAAIGAVEDTLSLQLTPERWEQVAELIEAAAAATAAGDLRRLRQVTAELRMSGPYRVIKPDGSVAVRADQKIFERANSLIHALQAVQAAVPRETGRDER